MRYFEKILKDIYEKKVLFISFGRRDRQLRTTTRILWGFASRKSDGPKPVWNLTWPLSEKNKKAFYKCITNRNVEENHHPFLDGAGNRVTKDEEKTEALNAIFASVFISKTSCSLHTTPLSWKTGIRSRMKPP